MEPPHPSSELLVRYRDGTLRASERKPLEAHLRECDRCRLDYESLCVLANIEAWKTGQAKAAAADDPVKKRVASDVEPFLGAGATEQILRPEIPSNLLPRVESALTVFLGSRAASQLVSDIMDHAVFLRGGARTAHRSRGELTRALPAGWARLILLAASCFVVLGLAAFTVYWRTGNPAWVEQFFGLPGPLAAIVLAAIELWFSLQVVRQFIPGDQLRRPWLWIAGSSACNLAGAMLSVSAWRDPGRILGGTARFALLAQGLSGVLEAYRRSGYLKRLRWFDWLLLVVPGASAAVATARLAARAGLWEIFGWPLDLLLVLLLAEGLWLFRSVRGMGQSWISRCWLSYTTGVFLTAIGNVGIWAASYVYLPRPVVPLTWYAWLAAAAAFALAPANQLEAIRYAATGRHARSVLLRQSQQ